MIRVWVERNSRAGDAQCCKAFAGRQGVRWTSQELNLTSFLRASCLRGDIHQRSWSNEHAVTGAVIRLSVGVQSKGFRPPLEGELLLFCLSKREVTKRKRHPTWRLPGILARQVRELGPGFSTGHPALAKRSRHPCRLPCGPVVPTSPPHRGPGRAARHPGAHSVRYRCAVARAKRQEQGARDPASCGIFRTGECLSSAIMRSPQL